MKTYSHHYVSPQQLKLFMGEHAIRDNSKLMIQVFTGVATDENVAALQACLQELFPAAEVIGTTTDGVISNGKMLDGHETVMVFTQFEKTEIMAVLVESAGFSSYETGARMAKSLGDRPDMVITFTDGLHMNGEEYLRGVGDVLGATVIAGGMAGDNAMFVQTLVFTKEERIDAGAVAVALHNPELQIFQDYTFNWMPIGKHMRVTKADKNRVYEIEGVSAAEIYAKYLGSEAADQLPRVGIEFPLVIQRRGVNVGRAVLERREDGSLVFAGNVGENELVRFGVGNIDLILRQSRETTKQLEPLNVESVFVYSCMARRRFMGKEVEMELCPLQAKAPTSGFFTYGEFFYRDGHTQLLNETMTILGLSEGGSSDTTDPCIVQSEHPSKLHANTMKAMANLANRVAGEFEELNDTLEERVRQDTQYILQQLYVDNLTGLPNRTRLISELSNFHGNFLVLVNIDDFTTINDFYGHHIGDYVIKSLGTWLESYAKDAFAKPYRMPGDEFGLVYEGEVSRKELEQIISNLSRKLNGTVYRHGENEIHIGVTLAAARIKHQGSGLAMADMALKYAKFHKLPFLIYRDDMMFSSQYEENLRIARSVREAIKNDRIVPYYQPIVDMQSWEIVRYECLARLIDMDRHIMSPYLFLPVAHKIHYYFDITKIMIDKAFDYFADKPYRFNLNLSLDDIIDPAIRNYILEKVRDSGMGDQVTFEILETQELSDAEAVKAFIAEVQHYGATVAIDDFGSGFANFENLTRINADTIKIDGSLIRKIDTDFNARVVVETIVTFAKKLGMKTVAEYVHSESVLNAVKELGIDYAQGYFLGRPEPALQKV
jgi:diguanylate cyclase (GGDEF)-like protein